MKRMSNYRWRSIQIVVVLMIAGVCWLLSRTDSEPSSIAPQTQSSLASADVRSSGPPKAFASSPQTLTSLDPVGIRSVLSKPVEIIQPQTQSSLNPAIPERVTELGERIRGWPDAPVWVEVFITSPCPRCDLVLETLNSSTFEQHFLVSREIQVIERVQLPPEIGEVAAANEPLILVGGSRVIWSSDPARDLMATVESMCQGIPVR